MKRTTPATSYPGRGRARAAKRAWLALVAGLAVLAGGCAATGGSRYSQLADVGRAYVATFDALADQAARSAVESDGRALEGARGELAREARRTTIVQHDRLLRERLAIVGELRRHAMLLGDYFGALSALGGSDAPIVAGNAAAELGDSLGALGRRLQASKVGEGRIGDLLRPAAELVVSRERQDALEHELGVRGAVIDRELALQEAAVRLLGDQLRHEIEVELERREVEEVARPFVAEGALPPDWHARRWDVLSASAELPTFEAAATAARSLREAFRGLVAGELGRDDLKVLVADLDRIRRVLEGLRPRGDRDGDRE